MHSQVYVFGCRVGCRFLCALGRAQDGFRGQHGPNLGRFWNHVGAILKHFWVLFWLLNLRPFSDPILKDFWSILSSFWLDFDRFLNFFSGRFWFLRLILDDFRFSFSARKSKSSPKWAGKWFHFRCILSSKKISFWSPKRARKWWFSGSFLATKWTQNGLILGLFWDLKMEPEIDDFTQFPQWSPTFWTYFWHQN